MLLKGARPRSTTHYLSSFNSIVQEACSQLGVPSFTARMCLPHMEKTPCSFWCFCYLPLDIARNPFTSTEKFSSHSFPTACSLLGMLKPKCPHPSTMCVKLQNPQIPSIPHASNKQRKRTQTIIGRCGREGYYTWNPIKCIFEKSSVVM